MIYQIIFFFQNWEGQSNFTDKISNILFDLNKK